MFSSEGEKFFYILFLKIWPARWLNGRALAFRCKISHLGLLDDDGDTWSWFGVSSGSESTLNYRSRSNRINEHKLSVAVQTKPHLKVLPNNFHSQQFCSLFFTTFSEINTLILKHLRKQSVICCLDFILFVKK